MLFNIQDAILRYFPGNDYDWVYYAPITTNTRRLMELVGNELGIQYERTFLKIVNNRNN